MKKVLLVMVCLVISVGAIFATTGVCITGGIGLGYLYNLGDFDIGVNDVSNMGESPSCTVGLLIGYKNIILNPSLDIEESTGCRLGLGYNITIMERLRGELTVIPEVSYNFSNNTISIFATMCWRTKKPTCSSCGNTFSKDDLVTVIITAPSCHTKGLQETRCPHCGVVINTKELPAQHHFYWEQTNLLNLFYERCAICGKYSGNTLIRH